MNVIGLQQIWLPDLGAPDVAPYVSFKNGPLVRTTSRPQMEPLFCPITMWAERLRAHDVVCRAQGVYLSPGKLELFIVGKRGG